MKISAVLFVLPLTLITAAPALAQTATPSPRVFRELRELRQQTRQELKENRRDLTATVTRSRQEARLKRFNLTQNGLDKSFIIRAGNLERYQKLINDRITQKLLKLPGNADLLAAQSQLAGTDLKNLWNTYTSDLTKYETSIKSITAATDLKTVLPEFRAEAKKVNNDLQAIRSFLVGVLRTVVKAK